MHLNNQKSPISKILLFILAIAAVGSMFACHRDSDNPPGTESSSSKEEAESTASQEEDEKTLYRPEQKNYDYDYQIVVSRNQEFFAYTDGESEDAVNVALFNRASFMEEQYGVTLHVTLDENLKNTLIQNSIAGLDFADVVLMVASEQMQFGVVNGYLKDLSTAEKLNLNASYWNQRIQQEYSINGSFYMLDGDFSIVDELRTMTVLYNADLYQTALSETYGDLYSLVSSNQWTYSRLMEMVADASRDLDGTEGLGLNDIYGLYSENAGPYVFFIGSGLKVAESVDGEIKLLFSENYQNIYNVLEDTMKLSLNENTLIVDAANSGIDWAQANKQFAGDHVVFRSTTLSSAMSYREMQSRFGILPIPMYTEGQDGYYSLVSATSSLPLAVPMTAKSHMDETLEITEIFCYYSRYANSDVPTLYNAFFDNLVYAGLCRTAQDHDMLEIIFASQTYDLDMAANLTGVYNVTYHLALNASSNGLTTLSSSIQGLKDSSNVALTEFLSQWASNKSKTQ